MNQVSNSDLDLTTARVIKAPRSVVWNAWVDPVSFAQWWIPAPTKCKVVDMDLRPGGSFVTEMAGADDRGADAARLVAAPSCAAAVRADAKTRDFHALDGHSYAEGG